jgi:hypothetical protein
MKPSGPSGALLVKEPGSALAEVIEQSLGAAGVRVTSVATPYEALVEVERAEHATAKPTGGAGVAIGDRLSPPGEAGPLRIVILGVDHFGREEFRLLPLVRRQWPDLTLVAYHSPGFEYKGRLAELVGADFAIGNLDGVSCLLEGLPPAAARGEARPVPPAAEAKKTPGVVSPKGPEGAPQKRHLESFSHRADTAGPVPPPAPAAQPPSPRQAPDREDLTEEELRLLLSEEDQA